MNQQTDEWLDKRLKNAQNRSVLWTMHIIDKSIKNTQKQEVDRKAHKNKKSTREIRTRNLIRKHTEMSWAESSQESM